MPAHTGFDAPLTYASESPLAPGTLVRVPLGKRWVCGVAWERDADAASPVALPALRNVGDVLPLPPLPREWQRLVAFTSHYYKRGIGEVALAALPPQLRQLDATQLARRLKRATTGADAAAIAPAPALTAAQAEAVHAIAHEAGPFLLHGVTGSGKTEVYLHAVQQALAASPDAQALVLVPEINLTPQLHARFAERFGPDAVAPMHSGMTNPQRLRSWLRAHFGQARIVLGTRMAVFTPLAALRLVIVDEEHDPSYKQQEGARYSARDLAVFRAREAGARVVLGSATPSLESWQAVDKGRYRRLAMPHRVGTTVLPQVRLVDMNLQPKGTQVAPALLAALQERVARGEQSLVFLNRRGYAPVLACSACDWKSECTHCSAFRVFHRIDRTLRCHHCGWTDPVPRRCPSCGAVDIQPMGRGTERLEEHLATLLADTRRPDGGAVRIARLDADTTRASGALERELQRMHTGEVDVLVGTQMVTKGHDFRRVTLVAAVSPDSSLYSADFRAPERLFSLLMQAAGRAGRDARHAHASEMWIQTWHPQHGLFEALRAHDFERFAERQLQERRNAGMPPFSFQALLRADARTQETAQAFLARAVEIAHAYGDDRIAVYAPVPMTVQRVADVERAQLLVESTVRPALQAFLDAWQRELPGVRERGLLRWAIDVDPNAI